MPYVTTLGTFNRIIKLFINNTFKNASCQVLSGEITIRITFVRQLWHATINESRNVGEFFIFASQFLKLKA